MPQATRRWDLRLSQLVDLGSLDDKAMTLLRRERVGFVFQAFNLIPTLTAQNLDIAVFVKLAPGVSPGAGRTAILGVLSSYPNATLMDQTQYKAQQAQQVNGLLNMVYGLLGLAVVIALIGIANTLALSIYERTHELGLLRAVGATRRQLRPTVRETAPASSVSRSCLSRSRCWRAPR